MYTLRLFLLIFLTILVSGGFLILPLGDDRNSFKAWLESIGIVSLMAGGLTFIVLAQRFGWFGGFFR